MSTLKATVAGFPAFREVGVAFDTYANCRLFTNAAGAGSCSFLIPSGSSPITHWVTAEEFITYKGAQKPFIVRTSWGQFHGQSASHSGWNKYENTIGSFRAHVLDIFWQKSAGVGQGFLGQPTASGGNVYVISTDKKLRAYNAMNGNTVSGFPKTLGGTVDLGHSTAVVSSGKVFAVTGGAGARKLFVFDAKTGAGATGFPVTLSADPADSPVVDGPKVFVATMDGKLHGYNWSTHTKLPNFPKVLAAVPQHHTITIAGGRLYLALNDSKLHAYDEVSGAEIVAGGYPIAIANLPVNGAPAVANNVLAFGDGGGKLYVVDERTGLPISGFGAVNAGSAILGSPAIAYGRIYVATVSGLFNIYRLSNASVQSIVLGEIGQGSPIAANGVVYVETATHIRAFDATNYTDIWSTSNAAGGASLQGISLVNGMLLAGTPTGNLRAYTLNGLPPGSDNGGCCTSVAKPSLRAIKRNPALPLIRN